jgi:membrane protease subunit (stomatin/prohibitin family)
MAANQAALGEKIKLQTAPAFEEYGLVLDTFVVENLSLPEELQKVLDQRISMNIVGDMGRFTQYEVAQSIPIAAGNEGGGGVGVGAGLGAGVAIGQAMMDAVKKGIASGSGTSGSSEGGAAAPTTTPSAETKFCQACGKPIPRTSKFCPECGKPQG